MAGINFTIINDGKINNSKSVIKGATSRAEIYTLSRLTIINDINVIFVSDDDYHVAIPEDKIGGRTFSSTLIIIAIDGRSKTINEDTIFELLCHELSHAVRWQHNTEYTKTLKDSLIFEGLATVFERQAVLDNKIAPSFFLSSIINRKTQENKRILKILKPRFNDSSFDYDAIFFHGSVDLDLPRWAGYSAGYHLIMQYLEQQNKTIEEIIDIEYKRIGKRYRR